MLRRQGDLLHAAGRGRASRPAGGVLPLRRLQPVDRPRGRPRHRRLPVLRHRLRRHRRPGRRQVRDRRRRWPTRSQPRWPAGERPAPARGLHRRRAAAAARRAARRRAARARASRSPSRPTAPCRRRAGIDWICVSPKAGADAGADRRRRAEAGLSAGRRRARALRRASPSTTSSCSRWTAPSVDANTQAAVAYCLAPPAWRLSLQTHKCRPADPAEWRSSRSSASRRRTGCPTCPPTTSARRLHGHSFRVEVHVARRGRRRHRLGDGLRRLKAAFEPLRDQLDHRYLNEIDGLENPTSEISPSGSGSGCPGAARPQPGRGARDLHQRLQSTPARGSGSTRAQGDAAARVEVHRDRELDGVRAQRRSRRGSPWPGARGRCPPRGRSRGRA